jgi:adenine-specific DNA-methyltransferase
MNLGKPILEELFNKQIRFIIPVFQRHYERNKRVIEGYTNAKGEKVDGLAYNNLRYYKSAFVGREPSIKNKKEITRLATELLCIKEDIYNEQRQIGGYQLNATYVRCFQQGHLFLLVIYDEDVIEQIVEVIQSVVTDNTDSNTHFKVYVFSNGQYPYTEEFEEVLPYITLCALPDAIYKAYQNVLPKRQRQQVPELEEPTAEDFENSFTEY